MAATVVDELVVQLSLDAEKYEQVERQVNRNANRTERQATERARRQTGRDKEQQKRFKDMAAGVRSFATQVTAAVGIVSGLGVAIGASLTGLLNFETGLRRQAVGTGLSNKQMQAWGATARRLGADAEAGASAIADLAREQKTFNLTGEGPTLQALARLGVRVGPDVPIEDMLAQAQSIYRSSAPGQQRQIESSLTAMGASPDLILMIKSETDAREAYTRSLAQATEENRKALDAFADTLESLKAQAISTANLLLAVLQPSIEVGAQKLAELATAVVAFTQDVVDAGGGISGFQVALDKNVPMLGRLFEGFQLEAKLLAGVTDIVVGSLRKFGELFTSVATKLSGTSFIKALVPGYNTLGGGNGLSPFQRAALGLDDFLRAAVGNARAYNQNATNAPWPKAIDETPRPTGTGAAGAQGIMQSLVSQYGLTPAQAAGVVANLQAESGLNPAAFNPVGGGQGAQGIAQWRGARIDAFRKRYGVDPRNGTLSQQLEFMMTDPSERAQLMAALRGGTDAASYGVAISRDYERHGNVAEDARRGRTAAGLASQYAAAGGTQISIQNMNVQANDANAVVGGLQRLSGASNYSAVQR
jgi:hypothetical protein